MLPVQHQADADDEEDERVGEKVTGNDDETIRHAEDPTRVVQRRGQRFLVVLG
jgi:hypothetical protein